MTERFRKNAATVNAILSIPGITVAKLQSAIYHLRIRNGMCAIYPCLDPPEPGRTQCVRHRKRTIEHAKRSKARREETEKFNEEWDKKQVKPVIMNGTLIGARLK